MGHRTLFVDHFFLYNKSEEKTCNEFLLILPPPFCQHLEKHLKYFVNLSSFLSLPGLGSKTTCVWGENPAKLHCWCKRSWFFERTSDVGIWGGGAHPMRSVEGGTSTGTSTTGTDGKEGGWRCREPTQTATDHRSKHIEKIALVSRDMSTWQHVMLQIWN